jgi:hypothetical protein
VGNPAPERRRVGAVLRRQAIGSEREPATGLAVRLEVAGHLERPFDDPCELCVAHRVLDRVHGERRRIALDRLVGHGLVAELRERVVSHVEEAFGDVLVGRDGEVPCEVEVRPLDLGFAQVPEHPVESLALRVGPGVVRLEVVAVGAEAVRSLELALRVLVALELAHGDDVAVAARVVLRGMDEKGGLLGRRGVRVELDPDRPALAGFRVDDDDRLLPSLLVVAREVVERDRIRCGEGIGIVEAGNADDRGLSGAEAVVERVGLGIDGRPGRVLRHRVRLEGDSPSGRARVVLGRVEVVWEGEHARRLARRRFLFERDRVALTCSREVQLGRLARGRVPPELEGDVLRAVRCELDLAWLTAFDRALCPLAQRKLAALIARLEDDGLGEPPESHGVKRLRLRDDRDLVLEVLRGHGDRAGVGDRFLRLLRRDELRHGTLTRQRISRQYRDCQCCDECRP